MMHALRRISPATATGLLIVLFALLRAWVGSRAGLSVDEAHYALYGTHLDWSYFDHPPLVGWLQALVLNGSDSELALRAIPIALFAATGLVLYRLTRRLFPDESPWLGFIAVVLLQSGLMFQLLGMAMLPDTPLLLIGLSLLLVLPQALNRGRLTDWLRLGLLLGLAGLSKYTAITLGATVFIAIAYTRQWRQFLTPAPWLAMLLTLLCLMPIVYWNAQHDWISFNYQLHHGTGDLHWQLSRWLASEAAQLLAYGFLVVGFGLVALIAARKELNHDGVRYCLALALPVLLLFAWNAAYVMTLPHWTALAWAGLLPLTARWIYQHRTCRPVRVALYFSAAYSLVLLPLAFSEMVAPRLPLTPHPLADLYGWQAAAQHAQRLRAELAKTPGSEPQLFTENWTHASRLAWYARPQPVIVLDQRVDQFDLWFGAAQAGMRGVLMLPEGVINPALAAQFAQCVLRDKLPVEFNQRVLASFSYYFCDDFHP
jgi:hypothetical protein